MTHSSESPDQTDGLPPHTKRIVVSIIRTDRLDHADLIAHLRRVLPKGIAPDARMVDPGVNSDADPSDLWIPVLVGSVGDETELAAVRDAVATYPNGGLLVQASNEMPTVMDDNSAIVLPEEPPDDAYAEVMELSDALRRIIEATHSETPEFPEQGYAEKEKSAYDHIVRVLGREPRIDRGERLSVGEIDAIAKPRRVPRSTWDQVTSHLKNEIRYFIAVRDWFGHTGNFHSMYVDQVLFRFMFLDVLNDTYLQLPTDKNVEIALEVTMGLTVKGVAALGPEGKVLSAAMDAIYKVAKATEPDYKAVLKGKISEMKNELGKAFATQIHAVERANARLVADWGLLEQFGKLVYEQSLSWPIDLKPMRTRASIAFHTEALSKTVKLCSPVPYVVVNSEEAKPNHKRSFDTKGDCHLRSSRSKEKHHGKYYYADHYLAYGGGYEPKDVPLNLRHKIFGTDQSSDWDPQLAMPARFLTQPKCDVRKGWGLKQYNHITDP